MEQDHLKTYPIHLTLRINTILDLYLFQLLHTEISDKFVCHSEDYSMIDIALLLKKNTI